MHDKGKLIAVIDAGTKRIRVVVSYRAKLDIDLSMFENKTKRISISDIQIEATI